MRKRKRINNHSQCIVLPFQSAPSEDFNGLGLALHFLIGNVMALHNGLKECWFGWKVNKIFPEKTSLQEYCRGKANLDNLHQLSAKQNLRFWLYGNAGFGSATIFLFDAADNGHNPPISLPVSYSDGLVEFRRAFLGYLEACGHPFPAKQIQWALWTETISRSGLDILGRALELFYMHSAYDEKGSIELDLFEKAIAVANDSFMAQNLIGWAFYRNQNYRSAKESFLRALRSNPYGIGAMSGLMWCGVYTGDREGAKFWAERKAEVRG
jgi:hypothetical protein